MSLPKAVADCSVCPRLCRDVCPVAVHGFRDDFIPSEKMRSVAGALGHGAGLVDPQRLLACTDCGACTAYCLLSIPIAPWLDEARELTGVKQNSSPVQSCETLDADALPADFIVLPVCSCASAPARERDETGAPKGSVEGVDGGLRCVPKIGSGHNDVPHPGVHLPVIGSTCCGQRLDASVGDSELRRRMARAMLSGIADGATVVVENPACAGHLQACADDRLRVVAIVGDPVTKLLDSFQHGAS